ncbi:MAG: efflux RND transporter periplasmic adaptor subunit [Clostridia bacterium]
MKKPLKWSIVALIILIVAGYTAYNWVKPLSAELIRVQPQTLTDTLMEEGIITAENELQVSSQISGQIEQMVVHEGDRVSKGSLLFTLDTKELQYQLDDLNGQLSSLSGQATSAYRPPYSSQLKQQELAIEQARDQLESAEKERERSSALFAENAISKDEYDRAQQAVRDKKNQLAQQETALTLLKEQVRTPSGLQEQYTGAKQSIQARIAQLQNQMKNGKVYAPIDGIVKQIAGKQGISVTPGMNVLTLVQPEHWHVEVLLLQEDIPDIQPGMHVTITQHRTNKDDSISGKVTRISAFAQETVSPLGITERRVKLHVQPDQLPPSFLIGSSVDVSFPIHTEQQKLVLPKTTLFPLDDHEAVWVVRDGKASIQRVKKGYETAEDVVIEEGLKAGDDVIRDPQVKGLQEGKRVIMPGS